MFQAKPAVARKVPARVALTGPTGSGKTYTALLIARGLVGPEGRIVLFDSERGTASRYATLTDFDHVDLEDFQPATYAQIPAWAYQQGYDAAIIDSLSHAWTRGTLAAVDEYARNHRNDSYGAWREATPEHNDMVDALLATRIHLVCTMRAKMEYVREEVQGRNGGTKTEIRKVGLAPVQGKEIEYEFDLLADVDGDHAIKVTKSRFLNLADRRVKKAGVQFGEELRAAVDGATTEQIVGALTLDLRDLLKGKVEGDAFDAMVAGQDEAWLRRAIAKAQRKAAEGAPPAAEGGEAAA